MLDALDNLMLEKVAGLHEIPKGAYNIRKNGQGVQRNTTANIDIVTKKDRPGIDILVKPHTKGESVHIPVIVTEQGINDIVYNTFDIGEGADVLIVAGCGIHNAGQKKAEHDGIHEFFIRKGARVKYVEKHYGQGEGTGEKVLNPKTIIHAEEGTVVELELVQIMGIDHTVRDTEVQLANKSRLIVTERLLTNFSQEAVSNISIELLGEDSSAQIISRSVAQGSSKQDFHFDLIGRNRCRGHIQCDAIIMDSAVISSTPKISAFHSDAQLVHEAAIGKLESQQLIKLMSLGLTEKEAEDTVLKGFLR
jgi:Fe-S cluster assembly scaffold protein SufB